MAESCGVHLEKPVAHVLLFFIFSPAWFQWLTATFALCLFTSFMYIALQASAGSCCIIHTDAVILSNWTHEAGGAGRHPLRPPLADRLPAEIVSISVGDLWVQSAATAR